jgi:hypothetical protein
MALEEKDYAAQSSDFFTKLLEGGDEDARGFC